MRFCLICCREYAPYTQGPRGSGGYGYTYTKYMYISVRIRRSQFDLIQVRCSFIAYGKEIHGKCIPILTVIALYSFLGSGATVSLLIVFVVLIVRLCTEWLKRLQRQWRQG